jgi:hypothetical protein
MPALYPIPGFSPHFDHIQPYIIYPHKPGRADRKQQRRMP